MSRMLKSWSILILCSLVLFSAGDAAAHQLYAIRTARVSELQISKEEIAVAYTVHFGEVVAFNERRSMDDDGDGQISEQEKASYVSRMGTELKDGLVLQMDGEGLPLRIVHQAAKMGEDRVGPLPFEMRFDFAADLPDLGDVEHEMSFADRNTLNDLNDPETSVEASGEIEILDSSQWWNSKRYAFDPWASREERRTVTILFKTGKRASPASVGSNDAQATKQISSRVKSKLIDFLRRPELSPKFILFAIAISIFLGAVHALEPGHGKTLVTIGILMVVARSFIDKADTRHPFGKKGRLIGKLSIASATVIIVLGFVIAIKSLISGGILVINL